MRAVSAYLLLMAGALFWAAPPPIAADEAARMTREELNAKLSAPDLVIIDVRAGGSWTDSEAKIKDAVREDPAAANKWAGNYPKDKTIVLYCA